MYVGIFDVDEIVDIGDSILKFMYGSIWLL